MWLQAIGSADCALGVAVMTTQHDSRSTERKTVFHIQPYARARPTPDPSIVCHVVIPGAAVICTRTVSRDTSPFPFFLVRGRETPDHPS